MHPISGSSAASDANRIYGAGSGTDSWHSISHTYDDVYEVVSACSSKNQDKLLTKPSLDLDIFDALGWKALNFPSWPGLN
ncbi:unnamed protein product [Danaus chrysippus]|uniref:(African queen) hypothetical protein n=1 Tax=Danaus chrysippus TaxID=151541 RepID=A0A8J2QJX8_9NEOP|nr:unnamed protein product [Danaus chrysippus]